MRNSLHSTITFALTITQAFSQIVTSHPVPEEITLDYYLVTINGQKVPVSHAGLNVYFASFDFTGNANVTVAPKVDSDKYAGQTLYLDAGAVLFGSINIWNAKNVSILGRGTVVYYGPQSEDHDDGWKNQKNWHPLTTHNMQGLTVRGVTFVGRSRTWSRQTHTTFDAVFDNIKIIAVNPQNINGDGIDWYGGGRTKVINSFIRSMDNCFAFFTEDSSKDMWATSRNTAGEVKDIYFENCVLWTTLANAFRIGFKGQALTTRNITMKNTDVIHISKSEWYAPWSLFCMVSPNSNGKANHRNHVFENIRFEEPTALFGLQNPETQFQNILLKDVTMIGEPVPSLLKNTTRGVTFDNVLLNGKRVVTEVNIPLWAGSTKIENASYLPLN